MTAEKNTIKGIIMFTLLLLSYIIFASNWVAGSNLSAQIIHYYFEGESVSPMVAEIINYTITIARIFANLLAAYVLLKLNPKNATIQAVIVVPIFAPKIIPTDWVNVSNPALTNDTTITVVAPDDWIIIVINIPVSMARKR